jgi:acylglycerol lipase
MKFLAVALLLLTTACAQPSQQSLGPAIQPPALTGEAFTMADGASLPYRLWKPEGDIKAAIVALHGFNDYARAWEMPAETWAKSGIATYAYDQRGFGRAPRPGIWAGDAALIADLRGAVALVAAKHPGVPVFVAGESMGGAVVMAAHAAGGLGAAKGAILSAPAVRGRETLSAWSRFWLWALAHTIPGFAPTVEATGIRPSDNIQMLRELGRDPLVIKRTRVDALYGLVGLMDAAFAAAPGFDAPAIFLIGANDNLIPDDAMQAMLDRLPPSPPADRTEKTYPAGFHMLLRDLGRAKVQADVADWVLERAR